MQKRMRTVLQRSKRKYKDDSVNEFIRSGIQFALRDFWLEIIAERNSLDRAELKQKASNNGLLWTLPREDPFELDLVDDQQLQESFKPYPHTHHPERPFVCEVPNGQLIGPYAIGLTENGNIITETVPISPGDLFKSINYYIGSSLQYSRILGLTQSEFEYDEFSHIFPLINSHNSYYHWLLETLPKVRLLEHYVSQTNNSTKILIESNPPDFVEDTINIIGYDSDDYIKWNKNSTSVNSLVIPLHRPHQFNNDQPSLSNYNPSKSDISWLRNRVLSSIDTDNSEKNNKRIFISRQEVSSNHTTSRKVVNYDEVIDTIRQFGFETHVLETLSFENQVRLFAQSDVIMGTHGAGFANMIFSDNPTIIELFPDNILRPHFCFLASMLQFEYNPLVTQSINSDLIVDVDSLHNHLTDVLTHT